MYSCGKPDKVEKESSVEDRAKHHPQQREYGGHRGVKGVGCCLGEESSDGGQEHGEQTYCGGQEQS